jgi:hypothetical protein
MLAVNLHSLVFDHEDRESMFPQIINGSVPEYTASHTRTFQTILFQKTYMNTNTSAMEERHEYVVRTLLRNACTHIPDCMESWKSKVIPVTDRGGL